MTPFKAACDVFLLHGIHQERGKESTVGFKTLIPQAHKRDYGAILSWQALWVNRSLAETLADEIDEHRGALIIGHSNGCAIASRVAELSACVRGLVMINPALDVDWKPPSTLRWMNVYYHPNDSAVRLARWIPFTRWGAMGATGAPPTGKTRVWNFNLASWGLGYRGISGAHNIVFQHFNFFGPLIIQHMRMRERMYESKHNYSDCADSPGSHFDGLQQ